MHLASAIDAALDRVVADSLRQDPDIQRKAKRVAAFDVAMLFWTLVFASVYAALGSLRCAAVTLWAVLPILVSLAALVRGRSPTLCGNILCAGGYLTLTALGLISGGWTGMPPMLWYTVLPVVAVLTCGISWGIVWTLVTLVSVAVFALLTGLGVGFPQEVNPSSMYLFGFLLVAGLLLCQFMLAWVRVGIEQRVLDALQEAERKLVKTRAEADALEAAFGFSMEDWTRVQREKAALEYFVECRFGNLGLDPMDEEMDNDEPDDEDAELAEFE